MKNCRITITINPINSEPFYSMLKKQGFKFYRVDEAISDDYQPIASDETLAKLSSGHFNPRHGTVIKAIYNNEEMFPFFQDNFLNWLTGKPCVKKFIISMDDQS